MTITEALKSKILVLDGAMGTMIQQYHLTEEDFRGTRFQNHHLSLKGNNDLLALTQPEILSTIHAKYFEAGADIAETNTFSSTKIAQADYGLEDAVYDLNYESARIAREVADRFTQENPEKPRFVAGSMGPTNRTASISPDVNNPGFRGIHFNELKTSYIAQAQALVEGGVDVLLIETVFDTLNAKAALFGVQEYFDSLGHQVPIMVSGTITDASGRTLSGQTTEAFHISLAHAPLLSIGLNCALGATDMHPYLQTLNRESKFLISAHPNAGLPNEFGAYDETPELMGQQIEAFLKEGLLNIVGGCCGTSPEHIKVIAELAAKYPPRKLNTSNDD